MSEKEQPEIVIIRRHASHEEGPHGGAWKIAFADFMTAMMALFLVLWLISSTSDKTKKSVAQYFNPVKLVDMTTLKKGFHDPKETEMGAGTSSEEMPSEGDARQTLMIAKDISAQTGAKLPTHTEAALFRDPYAVLAEIVASARVEAGKRESSAARTDDEAASDAAETFKDPFSTVPQASEPKTQASLSSTQAKATKLPAPMEDRGVPEARGLPEASDAAVQVRAAEPDIKPRARASAASRDAGGEKGEAEAAKLKADIINAVKPAIRAQDAPRIDVQSTEEGILVSLTDDHKYMMFAIGSAEPQPQTIEIMGKIGRLLKTRIGSIVIRGHTDGRPYKSATYDNWRLSAARAHMAHYMLVRGGLDEKRIEKIEGYADRRLKLPNDPTAAGNRRIEILLRKEKP